VTRLLNLIILAIIVSTLTHVGMFLVRLMFAYPMWAAIVWLACAAIFLELVHRAPTDERHD
jgi:Na+/citrate or Na+/malate symporter